MLASVAVAAAAAYSAWQQGLEAEFWKPSLFKQGIHSVYRCAYCDVKYNGPQFEACRQCGGRDYERVSGIL